MKKILILGALVSFFILSDNWAIAQKKSINFRRISPPGGFSLNEIETITQDNLGYIWIGTSYGIIRYDSNKTTWFVASENDSLSLPSNIINNLYCDTNNHIWVSTDNGLCKYIPEKQNFKTLIYTYEDGSNNNPSVLETIKTKEDKLLIIDESHFGHLDIHNNVLHRIGKDQIIAPTKLYKDNADRIWIGSANGDVFRYFPTENKLKKIFSANAPINSIYSENNQIWIGTEGEGAKLFTLKGEFLRQISFTNSSKIVPENVRVVTKDTYGRFWYGTYEGLYMDDGSQIKHLKPEDYPGIPHNSIYEIFEDKHGGLWFGTWSGGVTFIHPSDNSFQTYKHELSRNSISHSKTTAFVQLNSKELLIGTEVGGLNTFNLETEKFEILQLSEKENIENIKSLCKDKKGGLWVGTFRKGLWYRPKGAKTFKHFTKGANDGKHISSSSVYSLCPVDSGVWIGTFLNGVNFYSFKSQTIRHCFLNNREGIPMNNLVVNNIHTDSKSNLWIGVSPGFLYKIHLPSGSIKRYAVNQNETLFKTSKIPNQFKTNSVFYLWPDKTGKIWCCTNNMGIQIFDPVTNQFESFEANGLLKGKSVFAIIEDDNNKIWITSNNGLISYDPKLKNFRHFSYADGIQGNIFYPKAVHKDHQGFLYFGGTNGFTKINPNDIRLNSRKPFTIINQLITKENKPVFPEYNDNRKIKPIELGPEERTFRINFSSDNYLIPEKNRYKYRLVNYYDEWIENLNKGTVLFTSIDAGEYIFEVKAANNDGIWNDQPTQVRIKIRNYWYKTSYAYVVYFLIFLAFIYFIARFYLERTRLKHAIIAEKNKRENEEQMNEMKLRFFTNISHEFRTPLTLISWPLKRLLQAENINSDQREELEIANRNSNRLLTLINQIIDLRKLEKGKTKLNITSFDIIQFIKEIHLDFSSEAKSRKIDFSIESSYPAIDIEADPKKIDTIIYNILSNAYKYVPENGQIKVSIEKEFNVETRPYLNQLSFGEIMTDDFIVITIKDSGPGIDNEDLLKIFHRFEQGKQSTKKDSAKIASSGIGLAVCKDFTILHHGKIMVQSESGKGSKFIIVLPSKQKAQKILYESHQNIKNLKTNKLPAISIKKDETPDRKTQILVVEDNTDFRNIIAKLLRDYYNVVCVTDGNEALSLLKQDAFDLVVSDVMMPEMDGFELCKEIKTQIEISHIPVILLTALSSSENLIAGLDKGADAYITKPFEEDVLLKQIENILEQRKRLKENFSKKFISQTTVEASSLDNFFLNRVRKVIEKNISSESFSMDALANELMISRSQLHRKIKSLAGITTSEFVNLVRIKKAVELMSKENYRFNEVAFEVGFSSQSYFNRCFKKVYNTTPKEFFENHKTGNKNEN